MAPKTGSQIGPYIKVNVLPKGLSVSEAAIKLNVSRPTLSKLLNGRAELSAEMAARLQSAFGADAQDLLSRQAQVQALSTSAPEMSAPRGYAPPFLSLKARDIEHWADSQIDTRQTLAVLLRRLIHSTGIGLQLVDLPGFDNAERPGADGRVRAEVATAWIPSGDSVWEFGVTADSQKKANADFSTRTRKTPPSVRATATYVQVSPRNWPKKGEWESARQAEGKWKSVRALDASDLEQWLEDSIPAQVWLSEQIGRVTSGYQTLDGYWHQWSEASDPPIPSSLFEPAIGAHGAAIDAFLANTPERPFVVAADSIGEAIAFLACYFRARRSVSESEAKASGAADVALVFSSPEPLQRLATTTTGFTPIAATPNAESALPAVARQRHCFTARPRNTVDQDPDLVVEQPSRDAFEKALESLGFTPDLAEAVARQSGYSPTVLRRQRSTVQAIRQPPWAGDTDKVRSLVPLMFVGAWRQSAKADIEILEVLAGQPYAAIEAEHARLLALDDSPVWSAGDHRGVISKFDALHAVAAHVTVSHLQQFLEYAEYVLSERNPALDLPDDEQWKAALYKKTRDHSSTLRSGICETLVLLATRGKDLFFARTGMDVARAVGQLIHKLLSPLSFDKLRSHERDLPRYAEAAPDIFLSLIESDLRTPQPLLLQLLVPVGSAPFDGPKRTGLLWALERLAWSPVTLPRVVDILARLSAVEIDDNWVNKPINSLASIFRCWMPQTAATLDDRIRNLEILARRHPSVGWQICVQQFLATSQMGHYSQRPEWRSDAAGAGHVLEHEEIHQFARRALDLAIEWPSHSERTLGDLVKNLSSLEESDADRVWRKVERWANEASDEAKAHVRERIRRSVFTKRARRMQVPAALVARAKVVSKLLEPSDSAAKHLWLFRKLWVEESADEIYDDDLDYGKRHDRIDRARRQAMAEIWQDAGLTGALRVAQESEAPDMVGSFTAFSIGDADAARKAVEDVLAIENNQTSERFLDGFLNGLAAEIRWPIIAQIVADAPADQRLRVLLRSPFTRETWNLLDGEDEKAAYWSKVAIRNWSVADADLNEALDRLLESGRPRMAFNLAQMDFEKVEASRLHQILLDVAAGGVEQPGTDLLNRHEIGEAIKSLAGRPGVSSLDVARLEFLYIEALDYGAGGIPHLEEHLARTPNVFVEAAQLAFKRSDGLVDEDADKPLNPNAAMAAYRLLDKARFTPGLDPTSGGISIDALLAWIEEARRGCSAIGRLRTADQMIGGLLARSPRVDDDGGPAREICESLERVESEDIEKGFYIGLRNARGTFWRAEGGDQERELARRFKSWAETRALEFPVTSRILHAVADAYANDANREDADARVSRRLRR